ncbi:hypothetical protein DT065_01195 [Salicibibacter kimchii]|uniref:Uncharacterized protein n=1 Tax=Salicibibacter kimchii TaxID=2099786 RepID=A0A345BUY9_9BACI|nr:hypothetical protein DT065_01195 [Salicibibacter kimchii]
MVGCFLLGIELSIHPYIKKNFRYSSSAGRLKYVSHLEMVLFVGSLPSISRIKASEARQHCLKKASIRPNPVVKVEQQKKSVKGIYTAKWGKVKVQQFINRNQVRLPLCNPQTEQSLRREGIETRCDAPKLQTQCL